MRGLTFKFQDVVGGPCLLHLASATHSKRRAWLIFYIILSALADLTGSTTLSPLGMMPGVQHLARKVRWLLYHASFSLVLLSFAQ